MEHNEYIRDIDKSNTVVLFIHGILGSPNHFSEFLPIVPKNWAVHNILLDGHGKTVRDFSKTSMMAWKNQVCDKISKLGKDYENIVIVAHSMGTLLAIQNCINENSKIKALFLLGVPLQPTFKLPFLKRALKIIFEVIPDNDVITKDILSKYSIAPNKKLWEYIGWIPRYLELFEVSAQTKKLVSHINVPCYVYLSKNDELVSPKSGNYMQSNDNIIVNFLDNSTHFYYSKEDFTYIYREFKNFYSTLADNS